MARDLSTPEAVLAAIRVLYEQRGRESIPWFTISKTDPELVKAVERFFQTGCPWGDAVKAAGLPLSATHSKRIG